MSGTRERRIIHALLVLCILAGFACFAFIFLPNQLAKAGMAATNQTTTKGPSNISEVVPLIKEETLTRTHPTGKTIARFVPEDLPKDPFQRPTADIVDRADEDTYSGAGAAIEDTSFEAREHLNTYAEEETYESDLAIGDPHGEAYEENILSDALISEKPVKKKFRMSSLARGDPATIDSASGRRRLPWLIVQPDLEVDVAFWRDIYAKYDKNYVVLHHPRYLNIVYDVVDLSDIEKDPRLNEVERQHMREKRVEEHRERIEDALSVLATNPLASTLTHEQWRIRKLFDGVNEQNPFKRAYKEDGVRAQTGQRDKFIEGLPFSGRYLGEIEAIFEAYGVPTEITRLIFVESMFNLNAKSSAGASGIWQFMPQTGKLYLNINRIVDERNDPIKATHAAARLLLRNYEDLGTWPLAINAYNAGRGRLKQAVAQLGTNDIGKIVRNFSHQSYGFASRNFFLEFLAAYEVAEHAERYFGRIEHDKPLGFEEVRSNYHISIPEVARIASISADEIAELNPSFSQQIVSGNKLLPRRIKIHVPEGRGDVFLASAARAPGSRTGGMGHVVQSGETLSSIAKAYGVTPAAIMKKNRHVGRRLSPGQKLIIP
ncbi:MAG: transglycosylase SLT domain-containing protein [Pseudomonadota bacterium]